MDTVNQLPKNPDQTIVCNIDSPDSEFAQNLISNYLSVNQIPFLNQTFVIVSYQIINSAGESGNEFRIEFVLRRIS